MSEAPARIDFDHFQGVEIRTGTVLEATLNPKARVAAYVLRIDFGASGVRTSSAQITDNYAPRDLVGKQVVAVLNFEPKRIAGVKSEVLVLGAVSEERGVVLLEPTFAVENGSRIA
jgi:tRNA-binding protein